MSTTPLELPIARTTQVAQQRLNPRERDRLIRRAKALSWLSLTYMTAEAAIAVTARAPRRLGRAARLRLGLRDRSARIGDRDLALYRLAPTLTRRRTTRPTPRRDQRLPARPLHSARRHPRADRRRGPPHELARDRTSGLEHHRHAPARQREAPHRPAPGIQRHHRRRHPKPALRLPRRRIARKPRAQRRLRLWWADPAVALAIAILAIKEGHQTWQGESCCANSPTNSENNTGRERRLLPLTAETAHSQRRDRPSSSLPLSPKREESDPPAND